MRRPLDPRHHGLKEPKKVIQIRTHFTVTRDGSQGGQSLRVLIDAWNKVLREQESQGHRITVEPVVIQDTWRGTTTVEYAYEYDNLNYDTEKAEYDAAMAAYLEKHRIFKEYSDKEKNDAKVPNLDEKIARTERRLANLKAAKAGDPLPYPED